MPIQLASIQSIGQINKTRKMERLLKLVEPRPNSNYSQQNQGIFDIQTYQKAIDRMSCSSSLQQMTHPKGKRLSLSETVSKYSNYQALQNQGHLKQQIKPHQARQIVSRITEIIKTKREASKFLSSDNKNSQRIHQNSNTDKKVSYSAYINARKKIFQKQNPINYSTSSQSQSKQTNSKNLILEDADKSPDLFTSDYLNLQLKCELESHSNNLNSYMNNTMSKFQRIRLEGIVTKKKIQAKKPKQIDRCSEAQLLDPSKTAKLTRSFITVIKRRSNESHLMINNTKQVTSQRKIQQTGEVLDHNYAKNFINHTRLQEEEIEIYPQVSSIIKLGKSPQNTFTIDEVNSKSVTILHCRNGQIKNLYNLNQKDKLQIASITKTMTCYLILTIAEKFCLDIKKQKIIVSERASKMQGTSAKLAYSDILTVYDMLHALMLPSGNDAAISLGEWGGKQIRKYSSLLRRMKITKQVQTSDRSSNFLGTVSIKRKSHLKLFIHHMNRLAKFLNLGSTHFVNTHGLMNERAYSCSQNISLLTYYIMMNPTVRQIVCKKTFRCKVFNRTFSHSKQVIWQNTNKLLGISGFIGVKTGITPSAGPCLTSYFQISSNQYFIITILKTKSCQMRFKQTINLLKATILHLMVKDISNSSYSMAVSNLEGYNREDLKQDDKQFLNNCRQSTQSNQSNDEQNEEDFSQLRMNF